MTAPLEVRDAAVAWPESDMEVRAIGDGMTFRGYAAVFNSPSEDLGGFRETIAPGAFTRSVNAAANGTADIRMFWNHDPSILLGGTKARTLRLSQDEKGLLAEADLPDTSAGRDMAELVRRGDVRSMSFGFSVQGRSGESWSEDHKERTLHEVRLFEVSPVTGWPAYTATSASVRHLLNAIDWDDTEAVVAAFESQPEDRRDLILRALNPKAPTPLIAPGVAELLARLEAKRPAA